MRFLGGALLTALALLIPAGSALAARNAEVAIMDDQLLLGRSQEQVDGAMTVFREIGIERVRVSAFWRDHAPWPRSRVKPEGFRSYDHTDPRYNWASLDRVVDSAAAHGIDVLISITTPAPVWASASPRRRNPVWKPKPVEFARFAQAIATRYAAKVDMYALMNEPNQGAWLQPQSDRRGLYSPHLYRRMVNGAYPRIKRVDQDSTVLIGELSSTGRDDRGKTRPIRPLTFLREMACVDRDFDRERRGRCRGFEAPQADMLGHHPYRFKSRPSRRSRERDDAGIGDIRRLLRTLDRLTRRDRIRSMQHSKLDVYYTEFGYETEPPDPIQGVSLRRQDRWLQHAAYLTWRADRVRGITQFRLTDGELLDRDDRKRYLEFQSGLLTASLEPKTAFRNFPDPFFISRLEPPRGFRPLFWGQVRPGGSHAVTIQYRSSRGRSWRDVEQVRTNSRGYFTERIRARTGQWRYRWSDGRSTALTIHVRDRD